MANGTGSAKDAVVHSKDTSNTINQAELGDLAPERKDAYLKRLAKEQREGRAAYKKGESYIIVEGKKVLRKTKNTSGSEYTQYLFNRERYPTEYSNIERRGGFSFVDQDQGIEIFWPLKTVNGKEFKGGKFFGKKARAE
jgi:hypothetical protein